MPKVKQWKSGGEEDTFIDELIKRGKVNKNTKPSTLQMNYPGLFGEYSVNVIRNHLNMIKGRYGWHCDEKTDYDEQEMTEIKIENVESDPHSYIQATTYSGVNDNIHENYPVLCETYKDPDNNYERVITAVCLPSGSQHVKVELSDDGNMAIVKYKWPKTMFNMEDMFKKQLNEKQMGIYHPKILCLANGLERVQKGVNIAPEASIKINLPITVQTSADSWTESGVKRNDGSQIVMAEFKGYIRKSLDSTVTFDL